MHGLKGGRRKGASATNRYCTGPPTLVARLRPTRPLRPLSLTIELSDGSKREGKGCAEWSSSSLSARTTRADCRSARSPAARRPPAPGAALRRAARAQVPRRVAPKLTPEIKAFVDSILEADRKAPRKQRHTARRIWQRLCEERGADVSETAVRAYVRARKRQLGVGLKGYVPQHPEVARAGEVDFYEAEIDFSWGRMGPRGGNLRAWAGV